MTKLSTHGSRSPLYTRRLSEEDRITYQKWARGWYIGCSAVIIALLAVGFVVHRGQDAQTARRSRTVGFNALPAEACHSFG